MNEISSPNTIESTDAFNSINDINLTETEFPKQNVVFSSESIYTNNITLDYSTTFALNISVTNPEVLIYNFTSLANRSLEHLILRKDDITFNKLLGISDRLNSSIQIGELPIILTPSVIQFNLSVIDSPLIFPINFSISISKRAMIPISQTGNYYTGNTYPGEVDLFKIDPLLIERQIAIEFLGHGNASWDLNLINESGYGLYSGSEIHFIASPNESNYFVVDSSSNNSYNVLFRLKKTIYTISLGENTTIIEGPLLYAGDNASFKFNLTKNQQIRFTENGSRQEWYFSNLDTNETLFQNWYLKQVPINAWVFTWESTTMSQIIDKTGSYRLDIVQYTGNQFRIKITIHYDLMDLSKTQNYHGEIVGLQDFVNWYVNLTAGDELTIESTGNNFSLTLTYINEPYTTKVINSAIGSHIDYQIEYNGTYILSVSSSGYLGSFDLTISAKSPSNSNKGIPFNEILILTIFIVICLIILYSVLNRRNKR